MKNHSLGRLQPVDLRSIWTSEAGDFTPWLAQEENLTLLGETIGLDLELEGTEQNVGPFRADIVCKDTATNSWVLIENQLERTDHSHLGQLITYAAGLNAVTIVWIADRFTEEHRAALDWLNEVTIPDVNFFGLEVELWRIGSSPAAPKFNVASKPNDWVKTVTASRERGELTDTQRWQLAYWTTLMELVARDGNAIRPRKPQPQVWMDFAVGRTGFSLQAVAHAPDQNVRVSLSVTVPEAKAFFKQLYADKAAIEAEIGAALTWQENPTKKTSYISIYRFNCDPTDETSWPEQHRWLLSTLEAFHRVFAPRIKQLDATLIDPIED